MKTRRSMMLACATALVASAFSAAPAMSAEKFRISLETNPTHIRNKGAARFAEELKKLVGDKLEIEIYPSGQLFRDRDIPKALRQDAVEMAIPGTWQLDGVAPVAALQSLPMFYGLEGPVVHKVMDGPLGEVLSKKFEERMRVKVLGKWFDLGCQHFFAADSAVNTYDDLKGRKIRYPGGTTNAARMTALGGTPVLIPFPDLPGALNQGVIATVATTYESVRTSKLDEAGLKYSFEDCQYFGQYVPMIRMSWWSKQSKEMQKAVQDAWNIAADEERATAGKAQAEARDMLIKGGMKAVRASDADRTAARKLLMQTQPGLIEKLKIEKEVIDSAMATLKAAGVEF
ncbi:MAG: TRAP transporter substrate-binding protein DctP [Quisquiliibacterium sp.]